MWLSNKCEIKKKKCCIYHTLELLLWDWSHQCSASCHRLWQHWSYFLIVDIEFCEGVCLFVGLSIICSCFFCAGLHGQRSLSELSTDKRHERGWPRHRLYNQPGTSGEKHIKRNLLKQQCGSIHSAKMMPNWLNDDICTLLSLNVSSPLYFQKKLLQVRVHWQHFYVDKYNFFFR